MANWDKTTFKCSNPEVVKAFALGCRGWTPDEKKEWQEGATEFFTSTPNGLPLQDIEEISKRFPDDLINCVFSFEMNEWHDAHIFEFLNGERKQTGIEPNYSYSMPDVDPKIQIAICEKADVFFCKLDTAQTDTNGEFSINWFPEEVVYKFEYDGVDGKKYKVEVSKDYSRLDYLVFEGIVRYDWREIEPKLIHDDDIPF
jgi:hypothetical protein